MRLEGRIICCTLLALLAGPASAFAASPLNTHAPSVTGDPTASGSGLVCGGDRWNQSGLSVTYHWYRDGSELVADVGSTTFVPGGGDVGTGITCRAEADNGTDPTTLSPASGAVLVRSARPIVTGQAHVTPNPVHAGDVASCSAGFDDTAPSHYSYRVIWRLNGVVQSDTAATFTVPGNATGEQLACGIAATDGSGVTASSTTSPGSQALTVQTGPAYGLTVALAGAGLGTVAGAGISCLGTCSATYSRGSVVTLGASPSAGSEFAGWSGACSGMGRCAVTMDSDQSVTATFVPRRLPSNVIRVVRLRLDRRLGTAAISVRVPGSGELTLAGNGIGAVPEKIEDAGLVVLPILPTRPARRELKRRGAVQLLLTVTFVPTGGVRRVVSTSVTLRKRRSRRS
jgi:hypothetical protein